MQIVLESVRGRPKARLRNLSLGGCFVDSIARVGKGETVIFKVLLANGQSRLLNGEVVRVFPLIGFSLCFTIITEEEENLLKQIIDANDKGTLNYID